MARAKNLLVVDPQVVARTHTHTRVRGEILDASARAQSYNGERHHKGEGIPILGYRGEGCTGKGS